MKIPIKSRTMKSATEMSTYKTFFRFPKDILARDKAKFLKDQMQQLLDSDKNEFNGTPIVFIAKDIKKGFDGEPKEIETLVIDMSTGNQTLTKLAEFINTRKGTHRTRAEQIKIAKEVFEYIEQNGSTLNNAVVAISARHNVSEASTYSYVESIKGRTFKSATGNVKIKAVYDNSKNFKPKSTKVNKR